MLKMFTDKIMKKIKLFIINFLLYGLARIEYHSAIFWEKLSLYKDKIKED